VDLSVFLDFRPVALLFPPGDVAFTARLAAAKLFGSLMRWAIGHFDHRAPHDCWFVMREFGPDFRGKTLTGREGFGSEGISLNSRASMDAGGKGSGVAKRLTPPRADAGI